MNRVTKSFRKISPAARPFRLKTDLALDKEFRTALAQRDGLLGAHCIHELWMRGAMANQIEAMLNALWACRIDDIPEWLPMRHIEWLSLAYDVTGQFKGAAKGQRGRSNLYLVLLDYSDSRREPYGVYVGMTHYTPQERFDQHKTGIRAAGSVLKRGLELVMGPVLHLQRMKRADAERVETELADALRAAGLFVQGGH